MRLEYAIAHHLNGLHEELLAAIPALSPRVLQDGTREAVLRIWGDGQTIHLDVPDDLTPEQVAQIEQVIQSHDALVAAKAERIRQIKGEAYRLLQPTDWMVTRQQETGVLVPQAVLDYRAAVRAASDRAEQEIAALATVDEVRAYRVEWPPKPEGIV